LTLLISLFILNSCRNPDTVGLGLTPATQLNGSLIDTATVVVNTVREDSVITSSGSKTPLAYFNDPVLGTTESDIAVQLNLPGSAPFTLPSGTITVDSAVLVLRYADGFYGDSLTSKYKINVYQLSKSLSTSRTYYSNTRLDTLYNTSDLVGSRSFNARTHDSIKIFNIITGQPDTLIKVAPQLRVPINIDFINKILFNASATQLGSNAIFKNTVKGIYIALDKTATTGAGGTFMMNLADSINVYYRTVSGTTIDTTMLALPLGIHAAQIIHTPSAAVTTELNNTSTSRNVIYLQGLAGLRAKISFPYLKNILKNVGNIVINRAELVITPVPGSTIPFNAQPEITMYKRDIALQPQELQDATTTDPRSMGLSTFGGFYNSTLRNYHFVITGYLQDLMNGKTVDYGTYIASADSTGARTSTTTTATIGPTAQASARTIAVGTDLNSPYRIRLNIIYTKINK